MHQPLFLLPLFFFEPSSRTSLVILEFGRLTSRNVIRILSEPALRRPLQLSVKGNGSSEFGSFSQNLPSSVLLINRVESTVLNVN